MARLPPFGRHDYDVSLGRPFNAQDLIDLAALRG